MQGDGKGLRAERLRKTLQSLRAGGACDPIRWKMDIIAALNRDIEILSPSARAHLEAIKIAEFATTMEWHQQSSNSFGYPRNAGFIGGSIGGGDTLGRLVPEKSLGTYRLARDIRDRLAEIESELSALVSSASGRGRKAKDHGAVVAVVERITGPRPKRQAIKAQLRLICEALDVEKIPTPTPQNGKERGSWLGWFQTPSPPQDDQIVTSIHASVQRVYSRN